MGKPACPAHPLGNNGGRKNWSSENLRSLSLLPTGHFCLSSFSLVSITAANLSSAGSSEAQNCGSAAPVITSHKWPLLPTSCPASLDEASADPEDHEELLQLELLTYQPLSHCKNPWGLEVVQKMPRRGKDTLSFHRKPTLRM